MKYKTPKPKEFKVEEKSDLQKLMDRNDGKGWRINWQKLREEVEKKPQNPT